jgi:hypothetical protein
MTRAGRAESWSIVVRRQAGVVTPPWRRAVAVMVHTDMPAYSAVLGEAARVLRPDGIGARRRLPLLSLPVVTARPR